MILEVELKDSVPIISLNLYKNDKGIVLYAVDMKNQKSCDLLTVKNNGVITLSIENPGKISSLGFQVNTKDTLIGIPRYEFVKVEY